jgi:hypothetical protein
MIKFRAEKTTRACPVVSQMNLQFYRVLVLGYCLRLEKLGEIRHTEKHSAVPVLCGTENAIKKLLRNGRIKLPELIPFQKK